MVIGTLLGGGMAPLARKVTRSGVSGVILILQAALGGLLVGGGVRLMAPHSSSSMTLIAQMVYLAAMVLAALSDAQARLIPDAVLIPALGASCLRFLAENGVAYWWSALSGGLIMFTMLYLLGRRPGAIGGGDILLGSIIGLGAGFPAAVWAGFAGSLLAVMWVVVDVLLQAIQGKDKDGEGMVPLGLCLALGAWLECVFKRISPT